MPLLSIIIPSFNEENRLGKTLSETVDYLRRAAYDTEIIVVDDGSTDRTIDVAEAFAAQVNDEKIHFSVVRNPGNRGKGYAVRNGMLHASGEVQLFMDADLATPIDQIPKVMEPILEDKADIVFGSRAIQDELIQVKQSLLRRLRGRAGNLIIRSLLGMDIKDTQCGFKAFRRSAAKAIFPLQQIEGFGFDPELLFIGNKQGWRWLEVPVVWRHVEGSKVTMFSSTVEVLSEIFRIRLNGLSGKYGDSRRNRESQEAG